MGKSAEMSDETAQALGVIMGLCIAATVEANAGAKGLVVQYLDSLDAEQKRLAYAFRDKMNESVVVALAAVQKDMAAQPQGCSGGLH